MELEIEKVRQSIRNKKYQDVKKKDTKAPPMYITRFLCTVILTLLSLIGLKKSASFQSTFYKEVYEKNFSFASVQSLYQKYFGSTLPFENMFGKVQPVFSEKFVYTSVEPYMDGAKFTVTNQYLMPVLESGMVVFMGEKEGYGNTIIIQQVDGTDAWYSNIASNVKLYDYIEKGDVLGEVQGNSLYMVFQKNGTIVGYEKYM